MALPPPRGARKVRKQLSAFAMFSLKGPSLLAFDQRRNDANLKAPFGIGQIPSDTQTREILDPVDPEHLRPVFNDVFRPLQRGKALEPFAFYNGGCLLALDGAGAHSETGRQHQERLRTQCGPTAVAEDPPGDHAFLFAQVEVARRKSCSPTLTRKERGITREVSWVWDVPLNESHQDLRVNFLEYREQGHTTSTTTGTGNKTCRCSSPCR